MSLDFIGCVHRVKNAVAICEQMQKNMLSDLCVSVKRGRVENSQIKTASIQVLFDWELFYY
jgi:hypothetical protein